MSEAALRAAHAAGDGARMAALYAAAAEGRAEPDAAFLLTHAWVHALEAGLPEAAALEARLRGMGRA